MIAPDDLAAVERLRELRELPARIPALRREAIQQLAASGWSYADIGRAIGVSRQAVREWGQEPSA